MGAKEELQIFEEKVKDIFFYCCRYGVYTFFKGQAPADNFDRKELNRICKSFRYQSLLVNLKRTAQDIFYQVLQFKRNFFI